jgi:hypothetical protein
MMQRKEVMMGGRDGLWVERPPELKRWPSDLDFAGGGGIDPQVWGNSGTDHEITPHRSAVAHRWAVTSQRMHACAK